MRILVHRWNSYMEEGIIRTLEEAGDTVVCIGKSQKDFLVDAEFSKECLSLIRQEKIEAVFNFDYFPIMAMICEVAGIPYISWISDSPLYTLMSKTIAYPCNYIFCFDAAYTEYIRSLGAAHIYHLPLGTDWKRFQRTIENRREPRAESADISFVGKLYNEESNRLSQCELSEYQKGYIEGVISAQSNVYGYNFVRKVISAETVKEIVEKGKLQLSGLYYQDERKLAADAIGMEISSRERTAVVRKLAETYSVYLYTDSELPKELKDNGNIVNKGYADYWRDMPLIFADSRINLNITSKTIETGISQRVLDILACGGFCITNYQVETAEYFEAGKEIVMYGSLDELTEQATYYLCHEEERRKIAEAGYVKVKSLFSYEAQWAKIKNILPEHR